VTGRWNGSGSRWIAVISRLELSSVECRVGYGRVKKLGGPGSEGGGMSDFGIVVFMFIFNLLYIAFFGVGLS
jgi:hypothetical protein